MNNTRPDFNPSGLPAPVVARSIEKAAHSWCYETKDGGTFYVSEEKARKMQESNGGNVYPPED